MDKPTTGKPLSVSRKASKYSYGVYPWPDLVNFFEANRNAFMCRSKSASAFRGSYSGARNFLRSSEEVVPCSVIMASTICRGVSEYNGSGSNCASRNVLLSGPILVSKAWAIALVAATKAWFRANSLRYRETTAAVAFAACAAGRTQVGRTNYWGGSPLARTSATLVICPGYAFHVVSVATRVRAPVGS